MTKERIFNILSGMCQAVLIAAIIYAWFILVAVGCKNGLVNASELLIYLGGSGILLLIVTSPASKKHIWRIKNKA